MKLTKLLVYLSLIFSSLSSSIKAQNKNSLSTMSQSTFATVGYLQSCYNPQYQSIQDNSVWHYIAVTKNGLNGKIYLDGNLITESTYYNEPFIWNSLLLGASQPCVSCSPVPDYNGLIDDLRISNIERTQTDITNYYNNNLPFNNDSNTIGLYNFDSTNGTTLQNSGSGNNGTLYGGVSYATGKFGQALSLDGIDDYARISQSLPTNTITIEFWFKSTDTNATMAMFEYAYNTGIYLQTVSSSCDYPTGNLANGLISYYPFCGNANDASGNSNDGTVIGATLTTDRYGNANSAYSFNGSTNYIQTSLTSNLPIGNSSRSVSYWMKSSSLQPTMTVLGYGDNDLQNKDFHIWHNWNCDGVSMNISHTATSYTTGTNNNWNHFVFVYDNSLGTNISSVKVYMNGVLLTTTCSTFGSGFINTVNTFPMTIGKYHASNIDYFNGELDDIGIWNRALNQQEITSLYNGNLSSDSFLNNESLISIYPNPTNSNISIDTGNQTNLIGGKIRITNALGQEIYKSTLSQQIQVVSLSSVATSGLYFVTITDNQDKVISTKKIILK